ncbi:hypothetical protein WJX77_006197 [Trebouxia sp. C0004]
MSRASHSDAAKQARAVEAANADLTADRNEFYFGLPGWLEARLRPLLQDQRDLPILYLFFNVSVTVLPASLSLFACPAWAKLLGPLYLASSYVLFLERYLLALHYSQHRRLFKRDCNWLNWISPVLLAPLFGVPCGLYRIHHCVMHHAENNWYPKDLSSTEPYQRDYFPHFLTYWLRYLVGIWIELPLYAIKAQRWHVVLECLSLEAVYIALVACLWHINRAATVWTCIVPLMVTSFALMFGNWSQHIFINPEMPRSAHGMSYNCIGFDGNQRSFNDGYHTIHHLNSRLHWTQLPQHFIRCAQQQSLPGLVFEGIGFFDVGLAVFLGNYLAAALISRRPVRDTDDEESSGNENAALSSAALVAPSWNHSVAGNNPAAAQPLVCHTGASDPTPQLEL